MSKLYVAQKLAPSFDRANVQEIFRLLEQFVNALPQKSTGTFTLGAAASKTVTDRNVLTTSTILLMPTNADAGTLMGGASSLYVSARTAVTSFAVSTADGSSAAGTETFQYIVIN